MNNVEVYTEERRRLKNFGVKTLISPAFNSWNHAIFNDIMRGNKYYYNHENNSGNTKAEVKPRLWHFALAMLIILSFISPFFIIGDKNAKKWNEYLKSNGIETIAFYAYPAGRMSSRDYNFEYKVNGKRYTASLNKHFELPPNYPFIEIPIMIRYAEEKPGRSIVLPDKAFYYRGFQIKWITSNESRYYYVTLKKAD